MEYGGTISSEAAQLWLALGTGISPHGYKWANRVGSKRKKRWLQKHPIFYPPASQES